MDATNLKKHNDYFGSGKGLGAAHGSDVPTPVSRQRVARRAITAERDGTLPSQPNNSSESSQMRVVIAGGGIGGLVLAIGLLKQGISVKVLERDLTAIRGEGKYRGPIQVQSNALAALQALDDEAAEQVLNYGCITGDRVNGLCDGVSGEWYCKFDTFHPAVDKGLPVTRVISRQVLQEILAERVMSLGGEAVIENGVHVVDYRQEVDRDSGKKTVVAICEDGTEYRGDLLIGSDGIWSKIRHKMIGHTEANYSRYTCYTGISDFTPPDIDTVGYRVFLGHEQYFVSSDVGGGKMQWYGFHREPAGGDDMPGKRKERLMTIFGDWSDMVTDLIEATPEDDVLRRDIYDRPPIFKWTDGRVALLGDSAHAMQPNLGQGGCMAIEDAFQLSVDIQEELKRDEMNPDLDKVLKGYFRKRLVRAAAIHGMAGMAAFMASTYKAYLGEGLGPLEWMTKLRIPHPGRVSGQLVLKLTMPAVLDWVLTGYQSVLRMSGRAPLCRIEDKPLGFDESQFPTFMRDDDELLRAANADWYLTTQNDATRFHLPDEDSNLLLHLACTESSINTVADENARHFTIQRKDGSYCISNLSQSTAVLRDGRTVSCHSPVPLRPGDEITINDVRVHVKFEHKSVALSGHGTYDRRNELVRHPELSPEPVAS